MPRAFHDEERAAIKARLIEAGKKLINRVGTRHLVVEDAAREAGISKGSFYSFFPSREEFILEVFESWEEEYRGELLSGLRNGDGSPRERLVRFFRGLFAILEREPGLARLGWGEIERIMEGLPPERLAAHQAKDSRVLEQAFAEWAERGLVDPAALEAMPGIGAAIFAVAMHKEEFPAGAYGPATALLAEGLAMRIARAEGGGS